MPSVVSYFMRLSKQKIYNKVNSLRVNAYDELIVR